MEDRIVDSGFPYECCTTSIGSLMVLLMLHGDSCYYLSYKQGSDKYIPPDRWSAVNLSRCQCWYHRFKAKKWFTFTAWEGLYSASEPSSVILCKGLVCSD